MSFLSPGTQGHTLTPVVDQTQRPVWHRIEALQPMRTFQFKPQKRLPGTLWPIAARKRTVTSVADTASSLRFFDYQVCTMNEHKGNERE